MKLSKEDGKGKGMGNRCGWEGKGNEIKDQKDWSKKKWEKNSFANGEFSKSRLELEFSPDC